MNGLGFRGSLGSCERFRVSGLGHLRGLVNGFRLRVYGLGHTVPLRLVLGLPNGWYPDLCRAAVLMMKAPVLRLKALMTWRRTLGELIKV